MHKKFRKRNIGALSIILLVLAIFIALPAPIAFAEVSIAFISPTEGPVGTVVSLAGQITTENGSYKIFFADNPDPVKAGNATQREVSDTFIVPNSTRGTHAVILQDTTTGENNTADFTIQTKYVIKPVTPPHPKQLQQGHDLEILATITGGDAKISANITVADPTNATYFSSITIPIGPDGYGEASKNYPMDFQANAHTFYVGAYKVALVSFTETLAAANFTVGLTDAVEYHKFQTVHIRALNYTLTEELKITILHEGEEVFNALKHVSAPGGTVTANWTIPANAGLGLYTVNITQISPDVEKPTPDVQDFEVVPEFFACEVKAFNLDDEPAKGIDIKANDTMTPAVITQITNDEGIAFFYLEASNYTFTALLYDVEVGASAEISLSRNLTDHQALRINCSLVNIKAYINDTRGNALPFVTVNANFTYVTRANVTATKTVHAETDLAGIAVIQNLFINLNYTVKASRYDQTFATRDIENLTYTSWFNETCPTLELNIQVLGREAQPLQNAQVKVYDWSIGLSGLVDEANTASDGEAALSFTFGKYIVRVSKDGVLLNETSILLVDQPTNFTIYCNLYNLTLNVNVLDYFGQGIPNANVTIEREGNILSSSKTKEGGTAQFTKLVGGNYRILVYLDNKPHKITEIDLQEPKTVVLRIAGAVSIGGFITETSVFATIAFIVLLIATFLFFFSYRRLRLGQKKE